MSGFVFGRPEWWPALFLAPLALIALLRLDRGFLRRRSELTGPRVARLASDGDGAARRRRALVFSLGVFLAAFAVLDPRFGASASGDAVRGADIVVALDVSRSMLARDVVPDRLGAARRELRALAEVARKDRLALVFFAGDARLITPLTDDVDAFARLAESADHLSIPAGGSDLGRAVHKALDALQGPSDAARAILLVTDGEDLAGGGRAAAEVARSRGVTVHAAAFGTKHGGKIALDSGGAERFLTTQDGDVVVSTCDLESLRRLIEAGGGALVEEAFVDGSLTAWYERTMAPLARRAGRNDGGATPPSRAVWPLSFAILLWIIEPWLSARRRR